MRVKCFEDNSRRREKDKKNWLCQKMVRKLGFGLHNSGHQHLNYIVCSIPV